MQAIPRLTMQRCNQKYDTDNIILTPLVTDDEAIEKYTEWINDENIVHWVDKSCSVVTIEEEKKWATTPNGEMRYSIFVDADFIKQVANEKGKSCMYYEEYGKVMVGTCSITLSRCNTNATLGILIGEEVARGNGVGLTVIKMLTKYAFEELRVHRCHILMVEDNKKALKCYTNAGYSVCGTEHECFWYHGHYANVIHLEYLADEYARQQILDFMDTDTVPEEVVEDSK